MRHKRVPQGDFDMSAALVPSPASVSSRGRTLRRSLALAAGALALACGSAQAGGGWHGGGGGYHHGGYYHGGGHVVYRSGWGWDPLWGFGVGLGLAALAAPVYYDQPAVVYTSPPVYYPPAPTYYAPAPVYVTPAPAAAPAPTAAEPIFYPRNGQSAAQTEADRRACNSWATTQLNAMNDASVFQRATLACMDGRGYTAR
jgi:hypothetical protein